MPAQPTVDIIADTERASALLHPLRLKILEGLEEPDSAAGLARRLDLPRQKVNYHLRALEAEGLVEQVEERRRGNCVERVMRRAAPAFLIDPALLGRVAVEPEDFEDRFSTTYLLAVAARAIRELAVLRSHADAAGKRLATLTLQSEVRFASAQQRTAFAEELQESLRRLIEKYHDDRAPRGRPFRLLVGAYPAPERRAEDDGEGPEKND